MLGVFITETAAEKQNDSQPSFVHGEKNSVFEFCCWSANELLDSTPVQADLFHSLVSQTGFYLTER